MLGDLINDQKGALAETLTSKLGLPEGRALDFIQEAIGKLQAMFAGGEIDLSKLLEGSTGSLVSGLDLGSLTGLVGGDKAKAQDGVETILDTIKTKLADADDPQALLGGVLGGLDDEGDGLDAGDVMDGIKKLF